MPRTEEQYEKLRKLKRNKILDSSLKLFAEKGFSATSMSMIARNTGISKGLIYNYFESKEDLVRTLLTNGLEEFSKVYDKNKDGVLTEKEFVFLIDETFEILKSNIQFWRLYFSIMAQADVMKLIEKKLMELVGPFLMTLNSYYKGKGIKNPMAHAQLIGAVLDGVSMNYVMDPEGFPLDEIKEIILKKFI